MNLHVVETHNSLTHIYIYIYTIYTKYISHIHTEFQATSTTLSKCDAQSIDVMATLERAHSSRFFHGVWNVSTNFEDTGQPRAISNYRLKHIYIYIIIIIIIRGILECRFTTPYIRLNYDHRSAFQCILGYFWYLFYLFNSLIEI